MSCSSCQQHRKNIAQAVKAADVKRTISTTVSAVAALSENVGVRIATATRKK